MQLTNTLHQLRIDFEVPIAPGKTLFRFVNVLLIFGHKITLVDSGVKGSEKQIFEYIRAQGRREDEIETLILSHSHPDHLGGAFAIQQQTHCKILAHAGEQNWIEHVELQNEQRPVPGFFTLLDQGVTPDIILTQNKTLYIQPGITLQLIHAPGHSLGSLNIWFEEDQVLFTADSIPLRNDIPNYDHFGDVMRSLHQIRNYLPCKVLLTSWTPEITEPKEMERIISDAEQYMNQIDVAVKSCYTGLDAADLICCRSALENLGLPLFFTTPIVDRAFKSHFN